jgi:CheY-like chemotaxis protein
MKLMEIQYRKVLWVDDLRNPPETLQCDIARTYYDAVRMLAETNYDEIYLDHDLADISDDHSEKTGYDVCLWLAERKQEGGHVPSVYHFLTANPIGRDRMKGVIARYLT